MLVQVGMANTNGTEGKKTDTKENQEQQQTGQQKNNKAKLDEEPAVTTKEGTQGEKEVAQDTIEDDSVSKYNFIFHFLYKFKYEQEEEL